MEREPLGRSLGLRTPQSPATHAEVGTVLVHWTRRYLSSISRTSFDEASLRSCNLVSHGDVEPGAVPGGVVDLQPLGERAGLGRLERFVE
jgi:hypothetical protein